MSRLFHTAANRIAALVMKLIFHSVARIRVLRGEATTRSGPFLLAGNHISHFDPFIISGIVRRKIDWMAMAEFFPYPVLGFFLRSVDAFPADRDRADRSTIRGTLDRLKRGEIVGIFPEGGIRHGASSILEGAPLRPGLSALSDMGDVPVVPCVILGSDRLYQARRWLPFRRTPIWIAFGPAISAAPDLPKDERRRRLEEEFRRSVQELYAELRKTFALDPKDLPHSPRDRMKE